MRTAAAAELLRQIDSEMDFMCAGSSTERVWRVGMMGRIKSVRAEKLDGTRLQTPPFPGLHSPAQPQTDPGISNKGIQLM